MAGRYAHRTVARADGARTGGGVRSRPTRDRIVSVRPTLEPARPAVQTAPPPAHPAAGPSGATFFGHPRGLSTLFFTEMWERASYYGMRALLILFMTAATTGANPGMGIDVATASAIYGLYTGMVYLLALPGGSLADNVWGQRRSVFVGGIIIAL